MVEPERAPRERKPYAEPQLIEYGDLETLTRGSGVSKPDTQQQS